MAGNMKFLHTFLNFMIDVRVKLRVSFGMGDCISMSISVDSLLDETLNQGPLALLLKQQYKFPSGLNI